MKAILSTLLPALLLPAATSTANDIRSGDFDFPIYKNLPSGKQVGGVRAATDTPALPPAEAQRQFTVPEGFEMRLFAAEPAVVNPVAMTWDERGRLWVLELYEYPMGAKEGEPGRDRIKILEDTDADGVADKVHVWADGFSLGTGLILGDGGAYVGQAPHLLHLKDTNGDDRADTREVVLEGFGLEDRHELLNGFTWGPDGHLYMTHGVFTHSKVRQPGEPADKGVVMNAAVGRFHPRTGKFEVFADGTSNPWGVDFDARGNAFVSACVIDHLFHLAPGGLYVRQAGQPAFPHAYDLLPSIVDHRHHMAAYCGVQVYLGNQYPAEYIGKVMMGNIHDNSVHADSVTPDGASFKASEWKDFVKSSDGWFRPVSQQVGPDGALWVADWYDKYPCYQNAQADPQGVDREFGRIWRVVHTGDTANKPVPGRPSRDMDLAALDSGELVALLSHNNIWHRKTAQRLLTERGETAFGPRALHPETPVHDVFYNGDSLEARLTALWTLHGMNLLRDNVLTDAAGDDEPAIRAWAARLIGERGYALPEAIETLEKLASDEDATVRAAVTVAARQFASGSLTVNTPPRVPISEVVTGTILSELLKSSGGENDRTLNFLYWMALEPIVAFDPEHAMGYFQMDITKAQMPLAGQVMNKLMRRVSDMRDEALMARMVTWLGDLGDNDAGVLEAALKGLIEGQRGKALAPGADAVEVIAKLAQRPEPEIAALAEQLGTIWGDTAALQRVVATIADASATDAARREAVAVAGQHRSDDTRAALMALLRGDASDGLKEEAVNALTTIGVDDTVPQLIEGWEGYSPALRRSIAVMASTRWQWKWPFFRAVEEGLIQRTDVPPTAVRAFVDTGGDTERAKIMELFGRVNRSSAEKQQLIAAKRRVVLAGEPDLENGREVTRIACLVCHTLHGEGAAIGPDLTGVGRSSLDALLAHVIDPNQIIGAGYENVTVETRDGRSLSGRLVEESDASIKLINLGPTEFVISKDDIEQRTVSEMSLMPEGLEQMPDKDFRDMIWYVLAPPQDGPLTPERRRALIGTSDSAAVEPRTDGESIALWNPAWKVVAPDFEGTPKKHPEFAGRNNVLEIHPFDDSQPAALEAELDIPAGGARLVIEVASHERGDWQLRAFAQGELLRRETIDRDGGDWKTVTLDLSKFAGQRINVRLENYATDWSWEFAYWSSIELKPAPGQTASR